MCQESKKTLCIFKKNVTDEAIAECRKALDINPKYAPVHNSLGVAYEKKGMIDEAVAEFNEAVAINPNYAVSYNNLGLAYLKQCMNYPSI